MKKPTSPLSLVTRKGVAEMLGVSRQRVGAIEGQLPRPLDTPDGKPVWRREAIVRWMQNRQA